MFKSINEGCLKADVHFGRKLTFFCFSFLLLFFVYLVHYLTQQCREVVTCVCSVWVKCCSTFLYVLTECACSSYGYYLCNLFKSSVLYSLVCKVVCVTFGAVPFMTKVPPLSLCISTMIALLTVQLFQTDSHVVLLFFAGSLFFPVDVKSLFTLHCISFHFKVGVDN